MTEQRTCQNCKAVFTIEPEDFAFYRNIQVPPPTFCPLCRYKRRLASAHTMRLYRRPCNAPGHSETVISKYPSSSRLTTYDNAYWWSDAWDPMDFGRDYNWQRPFFEQLDEFYRTVPMPNSDVLNSINCDYCTTAHHSKNCYFVAAGFHSEECLYSDTPAFSKYLVDSDTSLGSDTMYECVFCDGSFNLKYSSFCESCMDSAFLYNCKGCSECFGCVNLRNKKYCIWNIQYSKEEYRKKLADMDMLSRTGVRRLAAQFHEFFNAQPHKYSEILRSVNCEGDIIDHGKNCKQCFGVRQGAENCKYCAIIGVGTKDSYDVFGGGATAALLYESRAVVSSERVVGSAKINNSLDVWYSLGCDNCQHIFACSGLRHKKYCIFNKQYPEKDYKELVEKIRNHMQEMPYIDRRGIRYGLGEFLPPEFSHLPYNESVAQTYYPLERASAEREGYVWEDQPEKESRATSDKPPDLISDVEDGILEEVFRCEDDGNCLHGCLRIFRIIPQELAFYRRTQTPIPSFCPSCRYARRLDATRFRVTNINMFERRCMCGGNASQDGAYKNTSPHFHTDSKCPNIFKTTYDKNRPEILYCEECYQSEL